MSNRISRNVSLLLTSVCLLLLAAPPATAQTPVPWPCTGEAFVIQDVDATLYRVDQTVTPFVLEVLCPNLGMEINNLGFCRTNGLLYAVQLNPNGNEQLIQIDANCDIFPLGVPVGWDPDHRFDAGELSLDGSTMYVTWGFYTNEELYTVSLADWQATPVTCTGYDGCVHDWAVHPFTGDLYGCDNTHGQLAKIDLALSERTDYEVPGLEAGVAFGGAWFNSAGRLFCYRNSGVIYEIDLVTKTIVGTQLGSASTRNDATACVPVGNGECGECEGKMTTLTLRYLGDVEDAWIEVVGFKNATAFQGTVQPGGTFVVDADVFNGTLGPELDVYVNGVFNTIIHTSCSQPIYVGQIWGDFLILAGASKDGGPLC